MSTSNDRDRRIPMAWTNRLPAESPAGAQPRRRETADPPGRRSLLDRVAEAHRRRRNRQLIAWIGRTAEYSPYRGGLRTHTEPLIAGRVVAVRSDLIEIAHLLHQLPDPDPASTAQLRQLLGDGCDSPLYNPELHPSELKATLYYVKARLVADLTGAPPCRRDYRDDDRGGYGYPVAVPPQRSHHEQPRGDSPGAP